ncbi:unnamed protein product [Lactuca saligna]|uniref:DUF4378 domain-containing protein n=1 Tax=Lactuca saligna TaxID=75948 RepID=A0AA35ZRI2_LACSI|nr:unnamed protein product [Lactuca saligna]
MNRNRNQEHPIPGCLGRMVNLFDLNTSLGANRLLTEKPHYEGSPVSRCQSDVSRTRVVEDRMNDKMILSELAKSPSNKKKSNGTPIKMLIAQEMSKEEAPKQSPSNLVAKLMGLDTLPERHQLGSASYRSNNNQRGSRSHSGSLDFIQKEHGFLETREHDEIINQSCKDVFEIWQQSPQKGRHKESKSKNEKNMALVREKFMEAKRLSTNEKHRQSKQFQDALEVLNSNKDLFLKFLQEPNSLFSQHHHLQSSLPPPDSRRITVLRPSKLVDAHKLNKNGNQINEALQMSHCNYKLNDKSPTQPTRIVVLKPSSTQPPHEMTSVESPPSTSNDDGFYGDLEEDAKETTTQSGLRRDENETILSSVFSNGYIGDESSFSKSEVYYAAGNLSDSEVMSPISRHSWDYVNRFGSSPYSSSSFSRASCSPESSVCREAKKRLSERWAIMSLNGSVQEQRHVRRSSSTLGEMLALSDMKKEECCENRQGSSGDVNKAQGDDDSSPKTLVRSKSVPVSSGSIMGQVSESLKVKKSDAKDLTKEKSVKSSLFKGLFFSKSRKSSKQKSLKDDEHQSSRSTGDDGSECINDVNGPLRKESCQGPAEDLPELGTFGNANENQEQPSPSSVLELQLEEDDHTAVYSCSAKLKENGVDPIKFNNLIDKSPPIGSISRTLSWDESSVGPMTPVPGKTWSPEEEEQEYFLYVQTLLSVAGINGSSPENPLDPSLRDTYMSLTDNHPVAVVHRSKQRQQKSTERLVFDCVNEALRGVHVDQVWERMKEWISGEERCVWDGDDEDVGSMAVERVVRREVVGRGWVEDLGLEIDDIIKKEIEEKLVEELVEELTLDTIRFEIVIELNV